ncbi:MAG: DJ-1/PfpI family protein [Phycisphaerae bacterium]|nr:DJ-1/PfpI family protein [Phycisphaerae bacterium]
MKKSLIIFVLLVCFSASLFSQVAPVAPVVTVIRLPEPDLNGSISLEQAIKNRRNIHQFTAELLKVNQISQLCWSAQGITDPNRGLRAAPSAGDLYPMQLYVALPDGLYLYSPQDNALEKKISGDVRPILSAASFGQRVVQNSPCVFVISGSVIKLEARYRGKGEKFAYLEAGHIAQNIHLQAVSLGLGSVPIGVFEPKSVAGICKLPENLEPLYLVAVGYPAARPSLEPVVAPAPVVSPPPVKPSSDIRNKRVVIFVLDKYFDDTEYFDIEDTFQIAGIQPVVASSVVGEINGIDRNSITATVLFKDVKVDDYDAFVFVDVPVSARNYFNDKNILNLVRQANEKNKILAAISTAPAIFANAGIVKGRNVTSLASERSKLIRAGAEWKNTSLEINGNIITAADTQNSRESRVPKRFGTAVLRLLRQQPD